MARLHLGLDVGTTAVRAAEISVASDPPALLRVAQVRLAPGAVEGGEVKDVDSVADAISELWRRGRFKTKKATMGVANQRVVVREVSVPALPEKELRQSLPFQVQEQIPIPVEDAVLDYAVLDEFQEDGSRMLRLLVVVAQLDMVRRLVETAQQAKVQAVAVDLVPFALVRALGRDGLGLDESERGAEAMVDVGGDLTNIVIHDRGAPRFVRILPSGGLDIRTDLAKAVGVSEEDGEALMRGHTVDKGPSPESVAQVLPRRIGKLVDEIHSSLEFYRAQRSGSEVSRVVVTGGGSLIPGLVELLREATGAGVERGHVFENLAVEVDEDALPPEAEPIIATSVGLALR